MATEAPTDTREETGKFSFKRDSVESGDRYTIYGPLGREITIVITDVKSDGHRTNFFGLAVERDCSWCGPWGRIIFNGPIVAGQETLITFGKDGSYIKQLKVTPWRLDRVRDIAQEIMFG